MLVKGGALSLPELIKKMSANPAKILSLPGGELKEGAPADLTLADLDEEWTVNPEEFVSKGKNTPFAGRKVFGRVKKTIVNGTVKFEEK